MAGKAAGAAPATAAKRLWSAAWLALVLIVFVALVLLLGAFWATTIAAPLRWLIIAALMVALLIVIGLNVNGRADGIFIDARFKISLSRVQIAFWTVLILSAFLTIVLPRAMPGGMTDLEKTDAATLAKLKKLSPDKALCFPAEGPISKTATLASLESPTETAELDCSPDPVRVAFPIEVVTAMGISAVSFAGSALVLSVKRGKKADVTALKDVRTSQSRLSQAEADLAAAAEETKERLAEFNQKATDYQAVKALITAAGGAAGNLQDELEIKDGKREEALQKYQEAQKKETELQQQVDSLRQELTTAEEKAQEGLAGLLHVNTETSQARWTDLFRGDEIGNYQLVDMSKVQMFFFTIVVIFSYGAAVYGLLTNDVALKNPLGVDFPAFSASLNGLLAISHAGYLSFKTVDHTKVESQS